MGDLFHSLIERVVQGVVAGFTRWCLDRFSGTKLDQREKELPYPSDIKRRH